MNRTEITGHAHITYKRPELDTEYDFIAVIDGLPQQDRWSFGLAEQITNMLDVEQLPWRQFDCGNKLGLASAFETLLQSASTGEKFCIQFVGHGNKKGLGVGANEFLTWNEFGNFLVPINEFMAGVLFLNMTSCNGLHGIRSVPLATTRDPFFGIIGPLKTLVVADAIDINKRLYTKWFNGVHINVTVKEINQELVREVLYCASAEGYRTLQAPE
jgi:hypothetical protein